MKEPILTIQRDNRELGESSSETLASIKVYGNNHERFLIPFDDLDESDQKEFLDCIGDTAVDELYFYYKERATAIGDIMPIEQNSPFYGYGFDGYSPDNFFSGILVKQADTDTIKVYTYIS